MEVSASGSVAAELASKSRGADPRRRQIRHFDPADRPTSAFSEAARAKWCAMPNPCYSRAMSDRVFFPAVAAAALIMLALALVWPQGLGTRSPGPFGHTPYLQTTAGRAELQRQADAARKRLGLKDPAGLAGLRPGK